MPEMALEPDIKGVCNVAGTLEISSTPRKIESVKIKNK
jgi:hypothetical protein